MEYYLAIKRNEILAFATAWMNLEDIMFNEIIQSGKDIYHVWNLKSKINEQTKWKQTHRHREHTGDYQREGGLGSG